jgi:hypothetical protein
MRLHAIAIESYKAVGPLSVRLIEAPARSPFVSQGVASALSEKVKKNARSSPARAMLFTKSFAACQASGRDVER